MVEAAQEFQIADDFAKKLVEQGIAGVNHRGEYQLINNQEISDEG